VNVSLYETDQTMPMKLKQSSNCSLNHATKKTASDSNTSWNSCTIWSLLFLPFASENGATSHGHRKTDDQPWDGIPYFQTIFLSPIFIEKNPRMAHPMPRRGTDFSPELDV
jgi:hypothetical protein